MERGSSNPLSAADKIYLGEFVITVLGLDEDSGESVEIPLDEATATSTHLGEDVLEESSWGGQDDQKKSGTLTGKRQKPMTMTSLIHLLLPQITATSSLQTTTYLPMSLSPSLPMS